VVHFSIKKYTEFFKRRFKLIECGLQLVLKTKGNNYRTAYIAFASVEDRNAVHDAVSNYLREECKTEETPIIEYTREWVKGSMSNFDYLGILNTYSQRSTQDLT